MSAARRLQCRVSIIIETSLVDLSLLVTSRQKQVVEPPGCGSRKSGLPGIRDSACDSSLPASLSRQQ